MVAPISTEFDPDALREKYREEREKRLRADGNEQYIEIAGDYARFMRDRYAEPAPREPITDEVEVLIVGGGFGGLLVGARLRELGIDDIRIVEKGHALGGTWYWNQYPGAQCDIEAYIYMPLLEELGYVPSERYVRAPEILEYTHAMARHYDLFDDAVLSTEVTEMRWDDQAARWIVSTNRGDAMRARFVAIASGPLHRPKLPGVEGINEFRGHSFHTSRWDYDYTGGDPLGGLDRLADKRVAIIGTGATAVQVVPHVGESAQQLYVFQRTPSSIDVRGNRPTDPEWASGLRPGWHKERLENFNALVSGVPLEEDLVQDGWTDLIGKMLTIYREGRHGAYERPVEEVLELANFEKMEEIRARVDELVDDPATAEALKPYYQMFCKRPCFHDEYLQTFNRPNVTLVDTDGKGVERITERGVVVAGTEYEVDCIIYATGFEVGTAYERRAGFRVIGRDGRTLTEKWDTDGMRTLHGMHSHGYPNCFIMGQSQGAFTANYTHLLDEAARHLQHIIGHARAENATVVEATKDAEDAWTEEILQRAGSMIGGLGGGSCTPGYYNNEGQPIDKPYGAPFGGGSIAFFEMMEAWRSTGEYAGLEFRPSPDRISVAG